MAAAEEAAVVVATRAAEEATSQGFSRFCRFRRRIDAGEGLPMYAGCAREASMQTKE